MKYLHLVWAGVWRKPSRATLLILQIATAFALFGTLQGLTSGIKQVIANAHADRLFVSSRVSSSAVSTLPVGILPTIHSMSGVEHIAPQAGFSGTWQKSDQAVPVIATDVDEFFSIHDEMRTSGDALKAMRERRSGAIAGAELMRRYGFKIGDRVVLQTSIPKSDNRFDWTFDLVGIYSTPDHPENADSLIANFVYLNETRLTDRDRASFLVLKVDSPANAGSVSLGIDTAFANSDHETRTQSEADRLASQTQAAADFDYIVRGIVGAVFFALLLATGTLIMQSVRERGPEFAILKTLGYSSRFVLTLILAEATILTLAASVIGLAIGAVVLPKVRGQLTTFDVTHMPAITALSGIGLAILLALLGASIPALQGAKRPLIQALIRR